MMIKIMSALFVLVLITPIANACEPGAICRVKSGFYRYEMPSKTSGPVPLIVFMHGYGSSSERVISVDRVLVDNAIKRGYGFLAAEGMTRSFEGAQNGWSIRDGIAPMRNDTDYLWDAINDLATRFAINRERIYLMGFSLGGSATLDTACHQPAGFAAFSVLNGAMWNPLPNNCRAKVKLLQTHGFADDVMPLEGLSYGTVSSGDVFAGFGLFRAAAGYLQPQGFDFTGEYSCRYWDEGAQRFCLYGGNHDWPLSWMPTTLNWFDQLAAKH